MKHRQWCYGNIKTETVCLKNTCKGIYMPFIIFFRFALEFRRVYLDLTIQFIMFLYYVFTNKNTFSINHKYTKSYKPSVKAKILIFFLVYRF